MSRFNNLELEDSPQQGEGRPPKGNAPKQTGTPTRDAAYFKGLADAASRSGDYEKALQFYSRALEDDRTLISCWFGQVRMLTEMGEYKEACLWTDRALELFPEHPDLLAAKAQANARMGLFDHALAYSDNAMSQKGASPFCWLVRGEVLLNRKSKMADHCFGQAVSACQTSPAKARVGLELSKVFRRYGWYSKALDYASKAAQAFPEDACVWFELGQCQSLLGLREARTSFEQALQLNPGLKKAERELDRFLRRGIRGRLRMLFRRFFRRR